MKVERSKNGQNEETSGVDIPENTRKPIRGPAYEAERIMELKRSRNEKNGN